MEAKPLENDFDPNKIAPGLYVTSAATPAYPTCVAMKVAGDAKLVGMAFEEDGSETVAFKILGGGEKKREVASNPRMQTSQRWLQNAVLDYEDWQSKWWRECVQNSADAKARNIRLFTYKNPDGTISAGCEDDGGGMALDILLNRFLVLGGTTKEAGGDTSGGFGKAKEMLLLPWISWMIHTRDAAAVGAGDGYAVYVVKDGKWQWHQLPGETEPGFPAPTVDAIDRDGTLLTVLMPSEKHTDIANAMAYVEKCWLPKIRFHFQSNAPEMDRTDLQANLRNGRHIRDVGDKARIYYTKTGNKVSKILCRTREGLWMFSRYLPSEVTGYVVIELLRPSIELLTSNRDGFSDYDVRRAMENFTNELAADTSSALTAKKNMITEIYQGERFKARAQREAEANLVMAIGEMAKVQIGKENRYAVTTDAKKYISDAIEQDANAQREEGTLYLSSNAVVADAIMDQVFDNRDACEAIAKQVIWKPAFLVRNDIEDFRVPSKFKPAGMTPSILRLAKVWTEFCRFVLTQLGCRKEWGVGWKFSNDARAALYTHDGEEWLVLNPFKSNSEEIYNPSVEADRNYLYSLAIHECTHLVNDVSQHNESFSTFMTINMGICAPGARKIKKIVESIPLRGQAEFEGKKTAKTKYSKNSFGWDGKNGSGTVYLNTEIFGATPGGFVIKTDGGMVVAWSNELSRDDLSEALFAKGFNMNNQEYARFNASHARDATEEGVDYLRINLMDPAIYGSSTVDDIALESLFKRDWLLKTYLRPIIQHLSPSAFNDGPPDFKLKIRNQDFFEGKLTLALVSALMRD